MAVKKSYIPITDETYALLLSLRAKTDMAGVAIYRYMLHNELLPTTTPLTYQKIEKWLTRDIKSAHPDALHAVVSAYEQIIANNSHDKNMPRIRISALFRQQVTELFGTHRAFNRTLLSYPSSPDGLNENVIKGIISGRYNTIAKEHFEFLNAVIASARRKVEF